ncbi:MAG: glycosyltransferase family 2 protein [Bacteroidia bacterium]
MPPAPLISILMPVKNAGKYLQETLDSIAGQTWKHWELIAIDDGSDDDSREILSAFQSCNPRVRWFQNSGSGIIPALNLAWQKSIGSFITRMDADDLMPPEKLRIMLQAVEQNPGAVVTGHVQYFSGSGLVSDGYIKYAQWLNHRVDLADHWQCVFRECVIASPNWLISRRDLQQTGAFHGLHYPEDYDLIFRWYRHKLPVVGIPAITHLWREHPDRTSRTSHFYSQEAFFRLKAKWFLKLDYDPERPLLILGEGRKNQLIQRNLIKHRVPFSVITKTGIGRLKQILNPQILVAVYPPKPAREEIEKLFEKLNLEHGRHYWWW